MNESGGTELEKLTDQVYRNCPYSDRLMSAAPSSRKTAIPTKVGDPSPIEHVIYIIKENRTYDQVFSDIPRGNRDDSLLMFGRQVTPNHHKLAEEYVLLDNLYCNGQVSADGHPWSTMAYNTDYLARNWALSYSDRAAIQDDDDGDLSNAPSGYIWDMCKRHGKTYRSYGEYGGRVSQPDGSFKVEGRVPGLVGHMSPKYGLPRAERKPVRDTDLVETFLEEFRQFEKDDNLPQFIVMSLGEDHTQGTRPGAPTPQACVASNDLALGQLVEAVSHSKYWPKIAIFVIEDDAQNGPDHVDAHRTIGLVISPYCRRHHLDSTQYATVSMLRTMELILGLPPLSQFNAGATPMFESFNDRPDLTPYDHLSAEINLQAVNTLLSYGARRVGEDGFQRVRPGRRFRAERNPVAGGQGSRRPAPPRRPPGHRLPRAVEGVSGRGASFRRLAEGFFHPGLHLVGGHFLDARAERPLVAERIGDHAVAVAPKHVGRRHHHLGPGVQGPLDGRVAVFDVMMQRNRGATQRGGRVRFPAAVFGKIVVQKEQAFADPHRGVHDPFAVGGGHAMQLFGPEGFFVKLDRLAARATAEVRNQVFVARRNRIDLAHACSPLKRW